MTDSRSFVIARAPFIAATGPTLKAIALAICYTGGSWLEENEPEGSAFYWN